MLDLSTAPEWTTHYSVSYHGVYCWFRLKEGRLCDYIHHYELDKGSEWNYDHILSDNEFKDLIAL